MDQMNSHQKSDIISHLLATAPIWFQMICLFEEDVTMGITDMEKFVAYFPGHSLKFPIVVNEAFKQGSVAKEIIENKKEKFNIVDQSVYGVVYCGGGIPIFENGYIVGSIVFGVSLNKQKRLMNIAEHLFALVQQTNANSTAIMRTSKVLFEKNEVIFEYMNNLQEQINRTSSIVSTIAGISTQTKILGLNALIEAAHIGQQGRGFSVVAKEIQKLADDSKESSRHIESILNDLTNETVNLRKLFEGSKHLFHNQFEQVSEISLAIETISTEAQHLVTVSEISQKR